ncbi:MAG: GIY-YIG nuclease family protein [Nitrospirae bacterium]|nr:GIY-YIG nuclease family protein [Nitrospirota bacterium]
MPYMYILECADGSYYTGSTWHLEKRIAEHNAGIGANYTAKKLPVRLVFCEEFSRIDDAFYREKQVQGWSHAKKTALIEANWENVRKLAECMNESHCMNAPEGSTFPERSRREQAVAVPSSDIAPFDGAPFDSAQGADNPVGERSRTNREEESK